MSLSPKGRLLAIAASILLVQGCDAFTSAETRLERAQQAMGQGDYYRAAEEAKKVLAEDPANVRARLALAEASLELGDYAAAETEVQRAVQLEADPARLEPLRVETLLALGRPEAARQALVDAKAIPDVHRAVLEGRVLLGLGKPPAALAAFDKALGLAPDSLDALVGRSEALVRSSRSTEARSMLESTVAATPGSGAAWLALGSLDLRQGRFDEAARSLLRAVEAGAKLSVPERVQARMGRVEALILSGDLEAAAADQKALEKAAPESPAALLTGARLALAQGEPDKAVDLLQRVVSVLPSAQAPRAMLVTALLERGSQEQALAEAGKLVGQFPDDDLPRISLAQAQLRAGRPDDAQATLRPLIDRPDPSGRAITLAAQIELRQGRSGAGLDFLERGVETTPDDEGLKLQLAAAYLTAARAPDAIAVLRSIPDEGASPQRERMLVMAVAASQGESSARNEIQRALNASPDDVVLLNLAAAYLSSIGDRRAARNLLERALKVDASNEDVQVSLARLDLAEDRLDDAERLAMAVLELNPSHGGALGVMVEVSSRRGQAEETERWLQEARRSNPGAVQPRLVLARRALARADRPMFDQLVSEIESAEPDSARVQSAIGDLLLEGKLHDEAMARFERAISLDDSLPEPYLGMARVQAAEKDLDGARASLKKALQRRPGWFQAAQALARVEASQGRLQDALSVAAELKERSPEDPSAWLLEGELYLSARRPAEALRPLETAFGLDPRGTTVARIYSARRMARQQEPERVLKDWLARTPGDVQVRRLLANHYMVTGAEADAVTEYEKIVAAAPDDAISLNNLAWLYAKNADSRAIEVARRAFELAPGSPSVGDTYAWLLVQAGQVRKGLDIFEQVADKAPDNLEIQYHYAYALKVDGKPDQARAVLVAALARQAGGSMRQEAEALLAELRP